MTVYADELFLINMLMDTTLLWAAGMLMKERIRPLRILSGAAAGSAMYIISLFFPYRGPVGQIVLTVFSITLSAVMAYRPKTAARLAKAVSLTVLLSFAASGAIFSFMVLRAYWRMGSLSDIQDTFSYKLLFITSAAFYIIIKTGRKYFIKTVSDKREYCDISVNINGIKAELRALADSGNSLRDNIAGSDVIIAEYDAVKDLIPRDMDIGKDSVDMFKILSETEYANRLRLIPFKSIGNGNGILLGIRTDLVRINGLGVKNMEKTGAILCLFSGRLDAEGRFNAIINYEIIL